MAIVLALLTLISLSDFYKAVKSNPVELTNICWSMLYTSGKTSQGMIFFSPGFNSHLEILGRIHILITWDYQIRVDTEAQDTVEVSAVADKTSMTAY